MIIINFKITKLEVENKNQKKKKKKKEKRIIEL
jgi:hypothetical protein